MLSIIGHRTPMDWVEVGKLMGFHQFLYFCLLCNFLKFWHFKHIISRKYDIYKNKNKNNNYCWTWKVTIVLYKVRNTTFFDLLQKRESSIHVILVLALDGVFGSMANWLYKLHKAKFGTSIFQQTLNQYQHAYQKDLQANDQDQDVCLM
jgi:hypothetical protein